MKNRKKKVLVLLVVILAGLAIVSSCQIERHGKDYSAVFTPAAMTYQAGVQAVRATNTAWFGYLAEMDATYAPELLTPQP